MLFDLEDYRGSKIIGPDHKPVEQISWLDPYTTARATRDAYLKAINEYYLASQPMSTKEEMIVLNTKMNNILESNLVLNPLLKDFFNAMSSLAILPGQAINEGDRYKFIYVPTNDTSVDWFECTQPTFNMSEGSKKVAVLDQEGDYDSDYHMYYKEMTQAFYDSYIAAFVDFQSKIKDLIITAEGGVENFHDYVAPDVHPWNSYPELSGYVRGTNNLTIKNAVVRLIDTEGASHDLVTDENGYYKFDKEMFYNNIAFDHGATASNFNMFVLEHTIGSTASLYDKTSIFQNSFFGAENNREFTWPAQVKMDKQARRNFKIDFIPDYSNYPSFSGYIKDAAGNPIKDAFMQIKDSYTGYSIGEYKKPNGDIAMNFKYNDFGVDRTILTDENGFYEYTSQMVGEWFNKQLMQVGEVAGNLGGRVFDDYFGSREDLICFYDSYSGRNLQYKESFVPILIPYKQDANSNSIDWEGTSLYDSNDYYTSRFKYALTSYNEFNYQRIDLDTHYDIDVDVTVATNDEFRANKFTVELETNTRKGGYDQMQQDLYCTSTTGYVKIVYPATGESHLWGGGDYYSNWHLSINYNNIDDYKNYYIYSCNSTGKAMGYIKEIRSGRFTETIDLSGVKYLNTFETSDAFYGESIDFSGLNYLSRVVIGNAHLLKNIIGLNSKKLDFFSLQNVNLIENIDISELTNLTYLGLEYLPLLESLDIQNNTKLNTLYIGYVDITLDVTGLTNLNIVQYNKLAMTSDDVDDLLIQLASTDLIGSGNVSIDRISRSSYSDDAFNTLMSRSWNINLGGGFYPDLIEPTKLVLTVDPNLVNKISENLYTSFAVGTSTGYWIGKLWNGRIVGYVPMINLNGSSINETFRLGTENATIEIYSCDYYGIPQGEIIDFNLSEGFVFSDIDTSELTELINLNLKGSGSIESLDLKLNINLETINLSNCTTIDSIDVTGLTSLKHINVENSSLSEVIGFSTLSSLETIDIQSLPNLSYLSFDGLNNIRSIYINEDDLYDSTHVDTMLSELNANSAAAVVVFDVQIAVKQAEKDAKQAEIVTKQDERTLLYSISAILEQDLKELNEVLYQLIEDGADQSLIDAKQAEKDAKQAELATKQAELAANAEETNVLESSIMIIETLIKDLNENKSFSGRQVNTYYMARTSASDADYDSLIAFGWTLSLGEEFIYPYSQPVKGFVTIDWNSNENSDDYYNFDNILRLRSNTGYVKVKSGIYSNKLSVNSNPNAGIDAINFQAQKGIMEFYCCDSHGRPAGNITGFGKAYNNSSFIKSFDISNLTDIDTFYFESGFFSISTIDLSSNINIKSLNITDWYSLESIVGFENLVNLKDIYMSGCSSLDIPVDFSSMVDLQRIYLYGINGINKNSRLNVSGLTRLQNINVSWINILSVDLDNALLALDAAGLDSEFDFNYEGHLSHLGGSLDLRFGMGIGYNPESASAFTSLQSKGWYLSVGDQIINSVEEPTKGIARWGMETGWAALYFYLKSDMSLMFKDPNGNIQQTQNPSFSFDSSMPEADRFVEFWAVDNYGRPRHEGITEVHDWWNTGVTSLEVNNITSITNINIPQYKGTSLDVSGMTNLTNINLYNSYQLESLNVDGCSKIREVGVNNNTNLDIDSLLESLDGTGSEGNTSESTYWLYGSGIIRSHTSDIFVNSLMGKNWIIDVLNPAGTTVIFNAVNGQEVNISVSTSGRLVKIEFPTGSNMHNNYPDGMNGWCPYTSVDQHQSYNFSFVPDFTGEVRITSMTDNDIISGEVRYISYSGGTLNYSTISNLKKLDLYDATSTQIISHFSNIELDLLNFYSCEITSLDLSEFKSKGICFQNSSSIQSIILNQNLLTNLFLNSLYTLTSINIHNGAIKNLRISECPMLQITSWPSALSSLHIQYMPIEEISILSTDLKSINLNSLPNLSILNVPNSLEEIIIYTVELNGVELDYTNISNLQRLEISYSSVMSIDITGLVNLQRITLRDTSLDFIGLATSNVQYFVEYQTRKSNYELVLPTTISSCGVYDCPNITSLNVTVVNNTWMPNMYFYLSNATNLNGQMVFPSAGYIQLNYLNYSTSPDWTLIDSRTDLSLQQILASSLDFTGATVKSITIANCNNLTSIVGLSGDKKYLNLQSLNNLTNIDLSNVTFSDSVSLNNLSNLSTSINTVNLYAQYCTNLNISGSNVNYVQAYSLSGSINMSNVTASWQIRIWWGNISSINLDNIISNEVTVSYLNGYNGQYFSMSMNNASVNQLNMYNNQKLNTFSALGESTSIKRYAFDSLYLKNISASLRDTYYFYTYNDLDNLTISNAELSASNLQVHVYRNSTPTATFIDSLINSVSPTSANNGQLRAKGLNLRTSESTTGFNKLISQGWSTVSM